LISIPPVFKNELKLLFAPDPVKEVIYEHLLQDITVSCAENIIKSEGIFNIDFMLIVNLWENLRYILALQFRSWIKNIIQYLCESAIR